jgi:hypothetical protein
MSGKISVGIDRMLYAPRIKIKRAKTAKVYGRRNASRTIHIIEVGSLHRRLAQLPAELMEQQHSQGLAPGTGPSALLRIQGRAARCVYPLRRRFTKTTRNAMVVEDTGPTSRIVGACFEAMVY